MLILFILVFGFLAGWIAQFLVFGSGRPGALALGAGLGGSFVGGLLAVLVAGDGLALKPSGIVGSVIGAVLILLVVKLMGKAPTG